MGKMTAGVANPQVDLRSSRRRHSIQQVADQFLHQYYTVFCYFPKYLHRFYKNKSTITISESLDNGEMIFETASGQEDDIKKKVVPLFPDARIKLDNYSPQFSMDEGILLLVTGRLCRKGMPDCEFAQSFYLAVQAKGFFVLNDIIRIMPSRKTVMDAGTQTDSAKTEVDVPSKLPSPPTITHLAHAVQPAAPKKVDAIASGQTQLQPPPPLSDTKKPKPRKLMSADASCDGSGGSPRSQQPPTPTAADVTPGSKAVGHGHERQPSPRRESNKPRKTSESQHQRHGQQQQQQQQPPSPQQPPIGGPRSARNGSSSPSSSPTTPRQTPRLTSPTLLSAQRARSVFVRSLPEAADEAALMEAFGTDGQVAEGGITIKQGRRDRFAFVELTSVEAVDAVLAREVRVMGKPVQVEEKRPMVIRRPGKGGGNGGGGVRRSFSGNMVRQTSGSPPGYISSVSGPRSFHQSSMANPAYV